MNTSLHSNYLIRIIIVFQVQIVNQFISVITNLNQRNTVLTFPPIQQLSSCGEMNFSTILRIPLALKSFKLSFFFSFFFLKVKNNVQPNTFEFFLFLINKHDTWSCTLIHTQVFMLLSFNGNFQNHCKTTPYSKFKHVDYARAFITTYIGVCLPRLANFHTSYRKKTILPLPSHILVCCLPTWSCNPKITYTILIKHN